MARLARFRAKAWLAAVGLLSLAATVGIRTYLASPTVLATDLALHQQNAELYYGNKPYSGYVEERTGGALLARRSYREGRLDGPQEQWYEGGQRREQRTYREGRKVGTHRGWWPNGKPRFAYLIDNDVPIGTHRDWYSTGQLAALFSYNDAGQPEGPQQMWFPTGQIRANYVVRGGRRYGLFGAKGCMGTNERERTGFQ
jgi:antitoxin component YwqK of YwqJK toxin-antitoxin module